jgi:GABA(A) receptor-associated protein
MMFSSRYKNNYSFEQRLNESKRVLTKYPDRIPIICEKLYGQKNLPDIDKNKYLVPYDLTLGQFIYVIKKRMKINADEAMFLFVNNKMMSINQTIMNIYYYEKDPDGFLYIKYSKESTFG